MWLLNILSFMLEKSTLRQIFIWLPTRVGSDRCMENKNIEKSRAMSDPASKKNIPNISKKIILVLNFVTYFFTLLADAQLTFSSSRHRERRDMRERASGAFLKTVGVDDDAVRKGIWHAKLLQTSYYSYLSHIYTFSTALLAVCWRVERNNNKIDNRVKDVWECWRWWWRAGWKGAKKSWRARKKIRRNTPNSNIYERFFSEQRMLVSTYIYVWQKFNFKFIFLCHIFPFHFSHPRSSRRSETHFSYQNVLVYC